MYVYCIAVTDWSKFGPVLFLSSFVSKTKVPFRAMGRLLESIPTAYGRRQVTPLNESPANCRALCEHLDLHQHTGTKGTLTSAVVTSYPKYSFLNERLARDLGNHMPVSVTFNQTLMIREELQHRTLISVFLTFVVCTQTSLVGVSNVCMVFKGGNQIWRLSKSFNSAPQAIIIFTFSIMRDMWIQLFICNWLHEQKYIKICQLNDLFITANFHSIAIARPFSPVH